MKKYLLSTLLLFISLVLFAQEQTKEINVNSFNSLDAGFIFNIEAIQSTTEKIVIVADKEVLDAVEIKVKNNTLYLSGSTKNLSRETQKRIRKVKTYIYYKQLNSINLSGATTFTSKEIFKGDKFDITSSGAVTINSVKIDVERSSISLSGATNTIIEGTIGQSDIDVTGAAKFNFKGYANDIDMSCSGAVNINLEGEIKKLKQSISGSSKLHLSGEGNEFSDIEISGASYINAISFPIDNLKVSLSGVSKAKFSVIETLDAESTGASKIEYRGTPKVIRAQKSTISSITKID